MITRSRYHLHGPGKNGAQQNMCVQPSPITQWLSANMRMAWPLGDKRGNGFQMWHDILKTGGVVGTGLCRNES